MTAGASGQGGEESHVVIAHDGTPEDALDDGDLLLLSVRRPEVFVTFYERHAEPLLRYFARRTLQADVAAELTAETFAQAYGSRARYRAMDAEAGAWLHGIARHQLAGFLRHGAVDARARLRLGMPQRDLSAEDYERIERLADLPAVRDTVGEALSRLPVGERRAVSLRVLEERTYAEIAGALACSQDAARARVSRGLRRMQLLLEPEREALLDGGWIG
jgi:RNA polymerase sigma-70 factor (ECF subfamily)